MPYTELVAKLSSLKKYVLNVLKHLRREVLQITLPLAFKSFGQINLEFYIRDTKNNSFHNKLI